jgi:branched-chain amino acid transport system substrate-binding protein
MYPNDADGNSLHPVHAAAFEAAGFTLVDASGFPVGLEDFTEQISMFKKAGAEQGHGVMPPADFTNFWKQSIQQGWMPKMSMWAKSLLFPESLEALGPIGNNLCCDQWWGPDWPFTSTVLGQTCRQFTDDFEAEAKRQWTQPLAHMMLFEWAIDLLQRTVNVDDKNAIMAAIKTTKLDTIAGPVDFSAPVEPVGPPWAVGPRHIVENVYKVGLCAGQWRMGGKYMFDLISVSNGGHPLIQVQDKALPYTEA